MAEVFVSYASEDRAKAKSLVDALEQRGWSVWWDMTIPPGVDYEKFIQTKLDAARCIIVLWSRSSIASRWVRAEANFAADRGTLVPVLIEDVEIPIGFSTIQAARLLDWRGDLSYPELHHLLEVVGEIVGRSPVAAGETDAAVRSWKRPALVVLLVVHGVAFSLLALLRLPSAAVRLDLKVSEIGFVSSIDQPLLTGPTALRALGVSGLSGIDLPFDEGTTKRYQEPVLLLELPSQGQGNGTISLDPVIMPAGTGLSLQQADASGRYRLSLEGALAALRVSVDGPVRAIVPGVLDQQFAPAFPGRVGLYPDSSVLDLELELASGGRNTFAPTLAAGDVDLYRIDRYDDGVRAVSTILSGQVEFTSVGKCRAALERGEPIRFARSDGEIRGLELSRDGIALTFVGRVSGMSAGSDETHRSLMPTLFHWVLARRASSLGLAVYLLGVAAGAIYGWRKAA